MKNTKIGIIGLGTVGTGVYRALKNFPNIIIKKIAIRDINKKRNIENFDNSILTQDPYEIVNDPEIDILVELAGNISPTFEIIKAALNNNKHIVTANKELLAKHSNELFSLANEKKLTILNEAAIAAAIPIIGPLKTTLIGNKINKIEGILNGTTNYILTKMSEDNLSYDEALKKAQTLGYCETDPTNDVMGYDAAYKICTLAGIAFKKNIDINKIYTEGISNITLDDIKYADEFGYKIKLVATSVLIDLNTADIRVHPVFVPKSNILANINYATNAINIKGDLVGETTLIGAGAGELPTASSVVGDILILSSFIENNQVPNLTLMTKKYDEKIEQKNILETYNEYYILIEAKNTKGVIGKVGNICGNNNISLSSLLQKGIQNDNTAKIVVITSKSQEADIKNAIEELKKDESIIKVKSLIRVLS